MELELERILANPEQPRTIFDEGEIEALADSLRQHGLLNPIAVEGPYDGYYVLLDGERRVRAARLAGWETIEAHIREGSANNGTDRLLMALVGNLQRADMGPVDEARAYARLRREMSVAEIGERVGRSDGHVYRRLSMLDGSLADEVLALINSRRLSSDAKMVRVLGDIPPEVQVPVAQRAAQGGWSTSRLKGICTRMKRVTPLHTAQRPLRSTTAEPAAAPAVAACGVELPGQAMEATVTVCTRCGMGDDRFNALCRDCPLPHFLGLMWGPEAERCDA